MPAEPAATLGRCLRQAARLADLTDHQLLDRFLARDAVDRDGAFTELVRRHGPMVIGVCRRVTRHTQDAEDAFQATFLVLARKAAVLSGQPAVGGWLYGVAYRVALKARATARKRREKEAGAAPPVAAESAEPNDWTTVLDAELGRLPDRLREPVVLCVLGDRPRREVAVLLGIPEGTLSSRLAKARRVLADRLRRCGLVLPAGVLAAGTLTAVVPPQLLAAVVVPGDVPTTVAKLATEVIRAMFHSKLRAGVITLAAVAVAAVAGVTTFAQPATRPADVPTHTPAEPPAAGGPAGKQPPVVGGPAGKPPSGVDVDQLREKELVVMGALRGTWSIRKVFHNDALQDPSFEVYTITFGDRIVKLHQITNDGKLFDSEQSFTVNPTTTPAEMTLYDKGSLLMALYELDGDKLRIAFHGRSEIERPRSFSPKDTRVRGMPLIVWELKRKAG